MDADPVAREQERLEKLAVYKARKEHEAEEARLAVDRRKEQKRADAKAKKSRRRKRTNDAEERAARKKEEQDFKATKAAAQAEKKKVKQESADLERATRLYKKRKLAAEKDLLRRLHRESNQRARNLAKFSTQFPLPQEALAQLDNSITAEPVALPKATTKTGRSTRNQALDSLSFANEELELNERAKAMADKPAPGEVAIGPGACTPAEPTRAPEDDAKLERTIFGMTPRNIMTLPELYDIMRERGMLLNRMKECKTVVIRRIDGDDHALPIPTLQQMLRGRQLAASGTQAQLIRRLQEDDARQSREFQKRFTEKPPVAEAALQRVKAKATGASGGKTRVKKAPTAGRFTAKPPPAENAPWSKRYSARHKTEELKNAGTKTPGATDTRGRGGAQRGAGRGSLVRRGTSSKAVSRPRTSFAAVPKTPLHSEVPEPTYAPMRMSGDVGSEQYGEEYAGEVENDQGHNGSVWEDDDDVFVGDADRHHEEAGEQELEYGSQDEADRVYDAEDEKLVD